MPSRTAISGVMLECSLTSFETVFRETPIALAKSIVERERLKIKPPENCARMCWRTTTMSEILDSFAFCHSCIHRSARCRMKHFLVARVFNPCRATWHGLKTHATGNPNVSHGSREIPFRRLRSNRSRPQHLPHEHIRLRQ